MARIEITETGLMRVGDRPLRWAPFSLDGLPREDVVVTGRGQGRLREMLGFAAGRTETLEWSWDGGPWNLLSTDRDMVHGRIEALQAFGIGTGWRIDETDLPLSFAVTDPEGRSRVLSFRWDGSDDDMMSLEPHVKRWNPAVRTAAVVGFGSLSWLAVYMGLDALGVF